MTMPEHLAKLRDEMALKQRIYEPKYGGKDHSGYDTLMKYEVNYEREEAFAAGFDYCYSLMTEEMKAKDAKMETLKDAVREARSHAGWAQAQEFDSNARNCAAKAHDILCKALAEAEPDNG